MCFTRGLEALRSWPRRWAVALFSRGSGSVSARARPAWLRFALGGAVASALATVVAVATQTLWVAVPALTVVELCMSTAGIAIQSAIQLATARAMRGRVMGLYGLIFRGAPAVGALAAGLASAYFGLRVPVLVGALIVIAACFWLYLDHERIAAALKPPDPDVTP
jgi:predicted MFS family arabinose efflux permease